MSKANRTLVGKPLRALLLLSGAALALVGACSSSDERQRAVQLAGGCLINSDCAKDLICAFGRCHRECDEDRDCDHELRCVKNENTGSFVCQLPDETICKEDEHCPRGQVCAVDLECRDSCKQEDDCVDTQVCAASGECASTDPEKADELDENGNIILESVSNGGTGGSSGGGGGGTEPVAAGASGGGTSGSGGTESMPVAGGAGEPSGGTGQGNTAGAPPMSDVDYEETEAGDPVDNDTREKAVAIQTSANLYLSADDTDWLSYQAPDDGRAHIITLELTQDSSLRATVTVLAAADGSTIGFTQAEAGTSLSVYFSVGSGTKSLVGLESLGAASGGLKLRLLDELENDEHEPNNRWQDAVAITPGQTVSGQIIEPYVRKGETPHDDWFKVTLAAGPATFELLTVPEAGRIQVLRRGADGVQRVLGTTANAGALATFDAKAGLAADAEGEYSFLVVPYITTVSSYVEFTKPAYFSEQYSFAITQ